MPALILASQSPRRQELLRLITPHFTVQVAGLDESAHQANTPAALAGALAFAKAQAVFAPGGGAAVIGCDTVVELDGRVLGKPADAAQATEMLGALSGRAHQVHTGVAVLHGGGALRFVESSTVYFSPLPPAEIKAVAATAEPYDKAGGYGIQGWAARFIPRIEGCFYNVMGLPVAALWQALNGAGLL